MHTIILIHGMGHGDQTDKDYDKLKKRLGREYRRRTGGDLEDAYRFLDVHWLSVTAPYEEELMRRCFPRNKVRRLAILALLFRFMRSLHYLMSFFIGDVIAYTSENDNGIRSSVLGQIREAVATGEYSFAAHSLGSVIAFDFLFHLFPPDGGNPPGFFCPGEGSPEEIDAARGNFRFFFSFGSPISLFLLRRLSLIPGVGKEDPLSNPADRAGGPARWINFLSRFDPVAYPAAALFGKKSAVEDVPLFNALFFAFAHLRYWGSRKMSRRIVEVLESEAESG